MLPDKIQIKLAEKVDGELIEVEKTYYYKFGYNAINKFRKSAGLSLNDFAEIFGEFGKPEEERDIEKMAQANEYFGKLFFHAVEEGMRIAKSEMDLSEEDIHGFLNDPENFESTTKIAGVYMDSATVPEVVEEGEKKN